MTDLSVRSLLKAERLSALLFVVVVCALFPGLARAQGAMTNGENHTGSIALAHEVDIWTFPANVGDSLTVSIGELADNSGGLFVPSIRLLRPDGVSAAYTYGYQAAQLLVTASQTGTYTVQVASADGANVGRGTYRLILAKAPGSFVVPAGDEGGPMTNGANHHGTILLGDVDMWSFPATAGDSLTVSIGELVDNSAGQFVPSIRLIRSDGVSVAYTYGYQAAQILVTAPQNGTYTVLVTTADGSHQGVGDYVLTLARAPGSFVVPNGDEGGPITNGANHHGTILLGDVDMWSFPANAGESLTVSLGELADNSAGQFVPSIRLIRPDGVSSAYTYGYQAAQILVTAPQTGTYTVLVTTADGSHQGVGDYVLTLAKAPGPFVVPVGDQGGALTNGANHHGSILLGDVDMWTFQANAGDSIGIGLGELADNSAGQFVPSIRLIRPDGVSSAYTYGYQAAQIGLTAPQTGTYTVLVTTADGSHQGVGDYVLTLAKAPGLFIVPADDEGGPLVQGSGNPGRIHLGDLDQWTLSANTDELITVSINEVTDDSMGQFVPSILLIRPDGSAAAYTYGYTSAQITYRATQTGTYTVRVTTADGGHEGVGTYYLTSSHAGVHLFSYVALGDSYSSGKGVTPYFNSINALTGCQRSPGAYPMYLRTPGTLQPIAGRSDTQFDFVACSEAVTGNLRASGEGQNGEPPQLAPENGVNARRDLVTVTVGEYDTQFARTLAYCLAHDHCNHLKPFLPYLDAELEDLFPQWVAAAKDRLVDVYAEIRNATPNAATLVTGYPMLLSGQDCVAARVPLHEVARLSDLEQVFLRDANLQVNTAIAEAAAQIGLHFVSVTDHFAGHEICGGSDGWINGVIPQDLKASFHPTSTGQFEYAQTINAYLESKSTGWPFGYLPSGLPRNPDPTFGLQRRSTVTATPSLGLQGRSTSATPSFAARGRSGANTTPYPGLPRRSSPAAGGALPDLAELSIATAATTSTACEAARDVIVPGQALSMTGAGFAPFEAVTLSLTLSGLESNSTVPLGNVTADAAGTVDTAVAVPASAPIGAFGAVEALAAGPQAAGRLLFALVRVQGDSDGNGIPDICDITVIP